MDHGADIIDIGGETTKPGAGRTPAHVEARRVLPVVEALVDAGATVSVDTKRADLAEPAVQRGATMINDVSSGLADPHMLDVISDTAVPYVVMHWRGHSRHMDRGGPVHRCGQRGARRTREPVRSRHRGGSRSTTDHRRPGPRVRQELRAQLGGRRRPQSSDRPGPADPHRRLAKAIPRRRLLFEWPRSLARLPLSAGRGLRRKLAEAVLV